MKKKKENKKPEKTKGKKPETSEQMKEDPQQLAMKYTFFKEQGEVAVQELRRLEMIKEDFMAAKETLEGVINTKKGDKALFPIGGNSYIRTLVDTNEDVLVGVGAGAVVTKPTKEAIKTIEAELQTLEKREKELIGNIKFTEQQIQEMVPELQKLQQQIG